MSTLEVCVSLHPDHSTIKRHVPVENGATKGTSAAGAAEEQVPDGVAEGARLGSGAEASGAGRTAEGQGDDLALGLARLNVRAHRGALGQVCAGESCIICGVVSLERRVQSVPPKKRGWWPAHVGQID